MWEFKIYKDKAGKYRWRLVASNGKKVATSGEAFASRANAARAARSVKLNAGGALLPPESQDFDATLGAALRRQAARRRR